MPDTPQLVCVGHIVREMIYFPGRTEGPVLGSPPAYTSLAAARQGTSTGIVTKSGPDMPQNLLDPLAASGVDMAGVRPCEATTATELIYSPDGSKEIRYPRKADPITGDDVPESFRGCAMIYVCTMDNDVLPPDIPAVVALGKSSAVDLGGYGGVHMSRSNRLACHSLPDLALGVSEHFQIVKASDEDAISIFGWDDPDRAAAMILERGSAVVVITAGAKGAIVFTPDGRTEVPPAPASVVDTTGGGDTFMAGFLSEFLRSGDPVRAARWGCSTSACVIEKSGGVVLDRMPTEDDVRARYLSRYGN